MINSIVDFDASTAEERFVVKSGIDAELDEMKRTYEGLEGLLSEVAMEVAESVDVPEKEKLNCGSVLMRARDGD